MEMSKISINFFKTSTGVYKLSVVQDGNPLFSKDYTVTAVDKETGHTQAQVFTGFCKFLQEMVDKEIESNPDFHWKSYIDFKKFSGSKMQQKFLEHESEYI